MDDILKRRFTLVLVKDVFYGYDTRYLYRELSREFVRRSLKAEFVIGPTGLTKKGKTYTFSIKNKADLPKMKELMCKVIAQLHKAPEKIVPCLIDALFSKMPPPLTPPKKVIVHKQLTISDDSLYEAKQKIMKKFPLGSKVDTPDGEGILIGYQARGKVRAVVKPIGKGSRKLSKEGTDYPFSKISILEKAKQHEPFEINDQIIVSNKVGGKLHSENDKPALVTSEGDKYWYKNGIRHRDGDKPAIEKANGTKVWYKDGIFLRESSTPIIENRVDGKLHSENDKPALTNVRGDKYWYKNGVVHRDGDKPAIIMANGDKFWYSSVADSSGKVSGGVRHREGDEPAVEYANGGRAWYKEGQLHRKGKPAIIHADGTKAWYKEGERIK